MIGGLYRWTFHPLYHSLKRDGVLPRVRELERQQWLAREEITVLARRKLDELLDHAGAHVPYYRDLLRESAVARPMDPFERLRLLPVLTKADINAHRERLVSERLEGNPVAPNSTSGSTGEALRFYTDARSRSYRKASVIRNKRWTGWQLGEPEAVLWGAAMDERRAASLRGRLHGLITRHMFLSAYDLTDDSMRAYAARLERAGTTLVVSYPGPLEQFALFCKARGVRLPALRAIISSAETLWPNQRTVIESAFGVPVFDRYGCREVGDIAQECAEHAGLHVNADRVLVEIVDEHGEPCPPGVEGEMLVTDLDNLGMPLIRYRIGDLGAWSDGSPCACGRGLPLLERIAGRSLDIVHTPTGNRIGGTFWTFLFKSRPGVRQFQVIQDALDGVRVLIVPEPGLGEETLAHFDRKIKERCGEAFRVEYQRVEAIPLTASGKTRIILSNLEPRADETHAAV